MHQTPDFGTPSAALAFLRANPDYIPTDADLASAEQAQRDANVARVWTQDEYDVAGACIMRALRERKYTDIPSLTADAGTCMARRDNALVAWDVANALLSLVNARRNRTTRTLRFQ